MRFRSVTSHGNAVGLYFFDPEDNVCEVYWTTPWKAHQPYGVAVDLTRDLDEVKRLIQEDVESHGETGHRDPESFDRQKEQFEREGSAGSSPRRGAPSRPPAPACASARPRSAGCRACVEAKPHCGAMARFSSGTYLRGLVDPRRSVSIDSSAGSLELIRPSTTILSAARSAAARSRRRARCRIRAGSDRRSTG